MDGMDGMDEMDGWDGVNGWDGVDGRVGICSHMNAFYLKGEPRNKMFLLCHPLHQHMHKH